VQGECANIDFGLCPNEIKKKKKITLVQPKLVWKEKNNNTHKLVEEKNILVLRGGLKI